MEAIGLVRTALHVQRSTFEALINAETADLKFGHALDLQRQNKKSFDLQLRMVRAALGFLQQLDALADEAIELAAKEKANA